MKNCRAYPTQNFEYDGQGNILQWQDEGMTLLDHFAGLAMQAYIARGASIDNTTFAKAYSMADAMIKERMKLNHEHFSDEDPHSIDSLYKQHFGVEQ